MKRLLLRWLPPLHLVFPAFLSGVLLSVAFPPVSFGALSFIALVPLIVSLQRRPCTRGEAFRAGYFFGLTFYFLLLWWIVKLLPWANVTVPWLMTPALILLGLYLSLYPAFFAMLLIYLRRRSVWAALFIGPALWTLLEIAHARGEAGFPWGAIGYALSRHVHFIQMTAWVGVFGLTFFTVLVNFVFGLAFLKRKTRVRMAALFIGLGLIAANGLFGRVVVTSDFGEARAHEPLVAVVQPNVSLQVKWDPSFRDSTFSLIERLSREASRAHPALLIFPETSAPVYIRYDGDARRRLFSLADEIEAPIFIGFLDARYEGPRGELNVYNSSGLFLPGGTLRQYDKIHLLPFGESVLLSSRFRFLRKIDFGQANFHPGAPSPPIPTPAGAFGPLICFESIFPELSRRYVRTGADFLVNITNDGWFGSTPGPIQHAEMAILRAVENRRYLLRSANTGISMVIDPFGRILSSIGMDREGIIIERIRLIKDRTFYTRYGEWPVVITSFLLILIGAAVGRW